MTTRYRRLMQLREMAAQDDATRKVAGGVSAWHMRDCKHVEPTKWYTEWQLIAGLACAFAAGVVMTFALLAALAMEG